MPSQSTQNAWKTYFLYRIFILLNVSTWHRLSSYLRMFLNKMQSFIFWRHCFALWFAHLSSGTMQFPWVMCSIYNIIYIRGSILPRNLSPLYFCEMTNKERSRIQTRRKHHPSLETKDIQECNMYTYWATDRSTSAIN